MPTRPRVLAHWSDLPHNGGTRWARSDEVLGVRHALSRPLGLVRVGVHMDVLAPGQRSSLPHAERWEEECVFVVAGRPEAELDGEAHPLRPGDIAVFAPGTGLRHTIRNHSDEDVQLLVIGERLDTAWHALQALQRLWRPDDAPHDATAADDPLRDDVLWTEHAHGQRHEGASAVRAAIAAARQDGHRRSYEMAVPSADRAALRFVETRSGGPERVGATHLRLDGARIAAIDDYVARSG